MNSNSFCSLRFQENLNLGVSFHFGASNTSSHSGIILFETYRLTIGSSPTFTCEEVKHGIVCSVQR